MSSGVTVTISLDPFLQHFLRGYFECDSLVFVFPRISRKNYLPISLKETLWYPPKDFRPGEPLENAFEIELPTMDDKDPFSMNYISPTANAEFEKQVTKFYYSRFYEFCDDKRAAHFKGPSIVNLFMDRYRLPADYSDRLKRDYSRYQQFMNNKLWKQKKKISI
jgi:hypothetical protein